MVRIRTIAITPFQCVLTGITVEPIYQQIAKKALHLKELGLSNEVLLKGVREGEVVTKQLPGQFHCIPTPQFHF